MRRGGRFSVVNVQGLAVASVASHVDNLGFGRYQYAVLLALGSAMLSENLALGSTEPMNKALATAYKMPNVVRTMMPPVVFGGEILGMATSGPLGDVFGRKRILQLSNVLAVVGFVVTASLSAEASYLLVIAARMLVGFSAGMTITAASVLTAESCPSSHRRSMMMMLTAIGQTGLLFGAIGLRIWMPEFGEKASDDWRSFCIFSCIPPTCSLVFTAFLIAESPSWSAIQGDAAAAEESLLFMASLSRGELMHALRIPEKRRSVRGRSFWKHVTTFSGLFHFFACLILLLGSMDFSRSFMVWGSAYVWPQLFAHLHAPSLNIVASIAPLIGLLICNFSKTEGRLAFFLWSSLASAALALLAIAGARETSSSLLCLCMLAKVSFGPLSALMALVKVESFPTEVRASAFATVSLSAKFGVLASPTISEILRGSGKWNDASLSHYLLGLAAAGMICGSLSFAIPSSTGQGEQLEDMVVTGGENDKLFHHEDRRVSLAMSSDYGSRRSSVKNIWDPSSDEESSEYGGASRRSSLLSDYGARRTSLPE